MKKHSLRQAMKEMRSFDYKMKNGIKSFLLRKDIPRHLKKYPNMNFNRNNIINVEYKMKKKPNFEDIESLPVKLHLSKYRIPSRLEEDR
jgi:hypothetical protein